MKNQKVRISLIVIFGIILAGVLGKAVWEKMDNGPVEKTQEQDVENKNVSANQENKQEEAANQTQENQDEQKTEDVSFCGKMYKADQVIINNIDVAKSVANISEKEVWLCKSMELGNFQESGIAIAQKNEENKSDSYLINFFHKGDVRKLADPFNQSPFIFKFDFNSNQIFYQSQIDGKFNSIGAIK